MIVLSCNNLKKSYGLDTILEDISFSINAGDKVALIGANGAGKTTLLNIISGKSSYDSGDIFVSKSSSVGFLKQSLNFNDDSTVFGEMLLVFKDIIELEEKMTFLENEMAVEGAKGHSTKLEKLMSEYSKVTELFTSLNGYGYKSEIQGVLKGLGFSEDFYTKKISNLSGGQKARISLGKVLLEKPNILFLDEPTNHLDIQAITWLEKYIFDYNGTVILISHDRYFLDKTIYKVLFLENSKLYTYNGDYTTFMKKRKNDLYVLEKQYENQKKEIERQEAIIKKFLSYGTERYVRLARSRQKLVDKISKVDEPSSNKNKAIIRFKPSNISGNDVLETKDLSLSYNQKTIFSNISFNVFRNDIIGLIGSNGIGKTSLLKAILSKLKLDTGNIKIGHNVQIGYFDQEQDSLNLNNTVIDEIWDTYPKFTHSEIRTFLARFLFYGDDVFKEVSTLSGGEKSRLALLKLMLSNSNFLLLDEPTNHLDLDSKEVLEDALLNYEGTSLIISHDRYFLNKVMNKILVMESNKITEYLGNYEYFLEKKAALNYEEKENVIINKTLEKANRKKSIEEDKKAKNISRKSKNIEKEIASLEEEIFILEKALCDPDIFNDHKKSIELSRELESKKELSNNLFEEWLSLES